MITYSDREYKSTKRIKQGKKCLQPPFDELAQWIQTKWKVTVLNIIYDDENDFHAPRLQVILEHKSHKRKFQPGVNYNKEKQRAIAAKFLEIIERNRAQNYNVDGLFVVFSAFAPIALQESDSRISDKEVQDLKTKIDNPDIWKISRCFSYVTFFFFTDHQVKHYEVSDKKKEYAKLYFALLKPHDEFGYLKEKDFTIHFDSKQNFDENYQSNWFNYYR